MVADFGIEELNASFSKYVKCVEYDHEEWIPRVIAVHCKLLGVFSREKK